MPSLSPAQRQAALRRFAQRRTTIGVIVATLGDLSDAERTYFKRQQGIVELQAGVNKAKPKQTSADRHASAASEKGKVDWHEPQDIARRHRLEKDPQKWLKHYMPQTFTRRFENPQKEIIAGAMEAQSTGGRFVVAAERGIGKSSVLWGIVLYLALSGREVYPICVPWADKALKRAFRFWKMALCFNDYLAADYPEFCGPFRHARGIAQRVMTTTWRDGPNEGKLTGAQLTVGEGMIVLPDQRGCIGGSTINGNVRGLNHPQEDGTVLRPSIVLLDDVQDRKTAKSAIQTQDVIDVINGDVAGCGPAGEDLPMLMSGNCILPDDVMAHYLGNPEWSGLRIPCILEWPQGWGSDKSKCRKLWTEWQEKSQGGGGEGAFFKKHRTDMVRGMKLSAPSAFRRKERSADTKYAAMKIYFKMGHDAFMAERQQNPERRSYSVYVLTPELVKSREDKARPVTVVPEWAVKIIAATDVNPSYALTTTITAYGQDQKAAVLWYGLEKMNPAVTKDMTTAQSKLIIYEALAKHGKEIAALPCRPNLWIIDGGGSPEGTVIDLAANAPQICGLEAACAFGRGWKMYRPTGKHKIIKGEQWHRTMESRARQWVIWSSDYWHEIAQKGWTAAVGAPGSCSLPVGRHDDFAAQVCREQLRGKDEIGGRTVWVWETAPGPHDYGDCMAMAYMGAAMVGIGTGGYQEPTRGRKKYTQADLMR